MLVLVCSSATCKPYAVPLLGKPHRREKPPPVPAPGDRLGSRQGVRAERSSPRGVPRGLPAAAAPPGTRGDAEAMLRTGTHSCRPISEPASHPPRPPGNPPSENRPAPAARLGPLFGGRRGLGWGLRARQDGLGERRFLSWVLNHLPAPVWGLPSAGAAQTRVCSHCLSGVRERAGLQHRSLEWPGPVSLSQTRGYRRAQRSARVADTVFQSGLFPRLTSPLSSGQSATPAACSPSQGTWGLGPSSGSGDKLCLSPQCGGS